MPMDIEELYGEYHEIDLLDLHEIQNLKEEQHNVVTGTIKSQIRPSNQTSTASLHRRPVQQKKPKK